MADPLTTIMVFQLTLTFCGANQAVNAQNKCNDGSEPHRRDISFGVRHPDGEYNTVEISEDNKPVFVMHQDGSVTKADGYVSDKDAIAFWQTMQSKYNLCRFEDCGQYPNGIMTNHNRPLFRPRRVK